jgi:hypothetical protein
MQCFCYNLKHIEFWFFYLFSCCILTISRILPIESHINLLHIHSYNKQMCSVDTDLPEDMDTFMSGIRQKRAGSSTPADGENTPTKVPHSPKEDKLIEF